MSNQAYIYRNDSSYDLKITDVSKIITSVSGKVIDFEKYISVVEIKNSQKIAEFIARGWLKPLTEEAKLHSEEAKKENGKVEAVAIKGGVVIEKTEKSEKKISHELKREETKMKLNKKGGSFSVVPEEESEKKEDIKKTEVKIEKIGRIIGISATDVSAEEQEEEEESVESDNQKVEAIKNNLITEETIEQKEICGAIKKNGKPCIKKPKKGHKYCVQHLNNKEKENIKQ